MKIERMFNTESNLSLQDVIQSIIKEEIDRLVVNYYDQCKVNTATSKPKGDGVA
jgi:hypothetical protein